MSTTTAARPRHGAPDEEPMILSWKRFLNYLRERINEIALDWPARQSLVVDWFDLQKHDDNLANLTLNHPYETLAHAKQALELFDIPVNDGSRARAGLTVRIANLPQTHCHLLRDLRAEHLGHLVSVRGRVVRAKDVKPEIREAVFVCQRCGTGLTVAQNEHRSLQEPVECYEDQGGCGHESKFRLVTGTHRGQSSRFVDTEDLTIEELPGKAPGEPRRRAVVLEGDLCGRVQAGDVVTIVGVLRTDLRKDKHGAKSTLFDTFLHATTVTTTEDDSTNLAPTQDELDQMHALASRSDYYELAARSLAPSLDGDQLQPIKLACLLQLFGATAPVHDDGSRARGDIHILLTGDPGVAKSQLVTWIANHAAPRAVFVNSKSATGAGLTAAVTRDEHDGRNILEAGAMPRADQGLLVVDELDKLAKGEEGHLLEGMEQQTITVSKVVSGRFQTRCAVLAAANPKGGRFLADVPIGEQLPFSPALLSRFCLIFVLRDIPNASTDATLARHIFHSRARGAKRARGDDVELPTSVSNLIEPKLLRKMIAHARETIHPSLTSEAADHLAQFYTDIRKQSKGGVVSLTARAAEALDRLACASARARLSKTATLADAKRAVQLYHLFMDQVIRGRDGRFDIDRTDGNVTERARHAIVECVRELDITGRGANEAEIVELAQTRGVNNLDTLRWLAELSQRNGAPIYQPESGYYKARRST